MTSETIDEFIHSLGPLGLTIFGIVGILVSIGALLAILYFMREWSGGPGKTTFPTSGENPFLARINSDKCDNCPKRATCLNKTEDRLRHYLNKGIDY